MARVIQGRLQKLAEDELPESQCGFRKGRGCVDMVFAVRQLLEKSWEHRERLFITFVDLRKAYDSVPRETMWKVLVKLGVPEMMVRIIKSFHQDMMASLCVDGKLMDPITVAKGLREVMCGVCRRSFSRESDKMRHKCSEERRKPVREQKGAVQCMTCKKWFLSRGGLAVHSCKPPGG